MSVPIGQRAIQQKAITREIVVGDSAAVLEWDWAELALVGLGLCLVSCVAEW